MNDATAPADLSTMTDARLVSQLRTWAGRVAAGEARVLALLGELDAREAYAAPGVLSCAHWAAWQLGWSEGTARDRVRVARCLRQLPRTAAALARGVVSYAQVRAICRIASPETEHEWLELARSSTAAQLERVVRATSRAARDPEPEEDQRDRVTLTWHEDGSLRISARISPAHALAVAARIEAAQKDVQAALDKQARASARDAAREAAREATREATREAAREAAPPIPAPSIPAPPIPAPPIPAPPIPAPPIPAPRSAPPGDPRDGAGPALAPAGDGGDRADVVVSAETPQRHRASLADGLLRALLEPDGLPTATVTLLVDPVSGWARTTRDELVPPSTLQQVLHALPGRGRGRGRGRGPGRARGRGLQGLQSRAWSGPQAGASLAALALGRSLVPGDDVRPLTAADLRQHDLGRRTREVSDSLRALLGRVDGERCRFPSCGRSAHLHAHHVDYWSLGGRTDLGNLVLVCARHHTLIHSQGFQLVLGADRTLTVRTRDGVPVRHHPQLPVATPEELAAKTAESQPFTCDWQGERLDLPYVVAVMAQHAA